MSDAVAGGERVYMICDGVRAASPVSDAVAGGDRVYIYATV